MPFIIYKLFSYKPLNLCVRVFLAGHTVAVVTCCVTGVVMCSPMIELSFDTMIVTSKDRVVIMAHQNESVTARNCSVEPLHFQMS